MPPTASVLCVYVVCMHACVQQRKLLVVSKYDGEYYGCHGDPQLKVTQGETYKLEESVKLETELIELRAEWNMMALQVSDIFSNFFTNWCISFILF